MRWSEVTRASVIAAALGGCQRRDPPGTNEPPVTNSESADRPARHDDEGVTVDPTDAAGPVLMVHPYGAPMVIDGPLGESVTLRTATVTPALSPADMAAVRAKLRSATARFNRCFADDVRATSVLSRVLALRFDVDAQGEVGAVSSVGESSRDRPTLAQCFVGHLRRLRFALPSPQAMTVSVVWSMTARGA